MPDELEADFLRFFGRGPRQVPPAQAARLASVVIRQTESWALRALDEDWQWRRLETHLAAMQADSLRWLQWAKTKDAQRGRSAPSPIPRPGTRRSAPRAVDTAWIDAQLARPRVPVQSDAPSAGGAAPA